MSPSWYSRTMAKTPGAIRTFKAKHHMFDNPTLLITRLLACMGIVLLIEQAASYYSSSAKENSHIVVPSRAHPMDETLTHAASNTHDQTKAIVVASTRKEKTTWVTENFPDWQTNIYIVDDQSANLTLYKNVGREAAVYLTYIINHYANLPDTVVFLHADRYQWHNDDPMFDGVTPIKNLRLNYVKEEGYVNLRCVQYPGCPQGVYPNLGLEDDWRGINGMYAKLWVEFFPDKPIPKTIGTACCAQFAVAKERILSNPVVLYEKMRQWLWATSMDDGRTGRIFEYMWHVMMGKPSTNCPVAQECYCKTFGLCELQCSIPWNCEGRYRQPPWDQAIPKDWPYEGQGTPGFPSYGWWQEWYPNETFGLSYIWEGMQERKAKAMFAKELEEAVTAAKSANVNATGV